MTQKTLSIGVIGDGAWGTTLAVLLANKGYPVALWSAFPDQAVAMNRDRENKKFLPGIPLPPGVRPTADLARTVEHNILLVLAVPSQYLPGVLRRIRKHPYQNKALVSVVKGIDPASGKTMSGLIQGILGPVPLVVLSGPTIAIEVARGIPTTAVAASTRRPLAAQVQEIFSCDHFRVYTNTDVLGVEICGSIKNVIALACGICDGLGFGTNTKAAILTRGLVEMTRLGRALGARPATFTGLTGLGDLATTCFSPNSRNRTVGAELGKGRCLRDILASMNAVAEGVHTVKAVHGLARANGIDMPITEAVYQILYRAVPPATAVRKLMRRTLKKE